MPSHCNESKPIENGLTFIEWFIDFLWQSSNLFLLIHLRVYIFTFLPNQRSDHLSKSTTPFKKHLLGYDFSNEIKAKVSLNSKTFYAQFSVDHLHGPSKNDRAASWVFHEQLDGLSHRNSILIPTANVWASDILLEWKICGNSVAVLVFSNLFSHRFKLHAT